VGRGELLAHLAAAPRLERQGAGLGPLRIGERLAGLLEVLAGGFHLAADLLPAHADLHPAVEALELGVGGVELALLVRTEGAVLGRGVVGQPAKGRRRGRPLLLHLVEGHDPPCCW